MQAVKELIEFTCTPSLEEAKAYIYTIDFSMIIDTMISVQGWKRKHAEKVCVLYRNYLYLCKKYGDMCKLPPSKEIDEFFHNHILDTLKYRNDCLAIWGHYHDHYPYFGRDEYSTPDDLIKAFSKLQILHRDEHGYDIYQVRGALQRIQGLLKKLFTRSVTFKHKI